MCSSVASAPLISMLQADSSGAAGSRPRAASRRTCCRAVRAYPRTHAQGTLRDRTGAAGIDDQDGPGAHALGPPKPVEGPRYRLPTVATDALQGDGRLGQPVEPVEPVRGALLPRADQQDRLDRHVHLQAPGDPVWAGVHGGPLPTRPRMSEAACPGPRRSLGGYGRGVAVRPGARLRCRRDVTPGLDDMLARGPTIGSLRAALPRQDATRSGGSHEHPGSTRRWAT